MPACFQLKDKVTGTPTKFQKIDDDMRIEFNQPEDKDHWLNGWYDCIGFALATGKDWAYCREIFKGLDPIIDYLEQRYTYDSWQEIGRSR